VRSWVYTDVVVHTVSYMKYIKLNQNWNAEPNAPDVKLTDQGDALELCFYLNSFVFQDINEGDIGTLTFRNVHKYRLGTTNDEGYFLGQFRFTNSELPWGEFYELVDSNWQTNFPIDENITKRIDKLKTPRHFIFFLRDETFECIADEFEFKT
jgi:hypothetical protein